MDTRSAAKALGWFSIGLGAVEVAAPGWLGRKLGVGDHHRLTRGLGVREIVTGAGILSRPGRPAGLWARVAGDALDLAVLAAAAKRSTRRGRVGAAIAMVAGVTAADALVARRLHAAA